MSFTVLAIDREAGVLGVATASRSLAVGNAVPALDPAVGVVATQGWTNRLLRHQVLDAMAEGSSATEAVARLAAWDAAPASRQVAAIGVDGSIGVVTGDDTTPEAGHRAGRDHVVIGNLLASQHVLDAMASVLRARRALPAREPLVETHGGTDLGDAMDPAVTVPFARVLVAALAAGESAGGDARGRQSAALLVARTQPTRAHPPELAIDLRIDDDPAPIDRLATLLAMRSADLDAPPPASRAARTTVERRRQRS